MSDIEFIVFALVFLAGCYLWREGTRLRERVSAIPVWSFSLLLAWWFWQ